MHEVLIHHGGFIRKPFVAVTMSNPEYSSRRSIDVHRGIPQGVPRGTSQEVLRAFP